MKGPYERLKYSLQRVWECPACKRRERTAGSVTFRHCTCQMKQIDGRPVVMKLVEDGAQRLSPPRVVPVLVETEAISPVVESEARLATPGDEPQNPMSGTTGG
jgi:hypothetical protein